MQPTPLPTATSRPSESAIGAPDIADPVRSINPALRVNLLFAVNERYTDNAALTIDANAQRDWVTDAMAGLEADYRGPSASARLDYRVNRLLYRNLTNFNESTRHLNSNASLEAIEKWLFIDAHASITQEKRSAFGPSGIAEVTTNSANLIETTTYQFAPYVRGNLRDTANYMLRVNGTETRTGEAAYPESRAYLSTGFLKNTASSGRFGWSIEGAALTIDNSAVGKLQDNRAKVALTLEIDAHLHVSLSAGREISNLDGLDKQTTNTPGFGLEWSPSLRTQIAAVGQKRFFGNEHIVDFSHRTPLTAWHFSSSKEVAISTNELATTNPSSVHSLLLTLLASSITDPVARNEAVQHRLEQTGMPNDTGIQAGYLSARPFIHWRQAASVALLGTRSTVALSVGRREQRAIGDNNVSQGGAASVEEIRETSANVTWAYRLSPVSTMRLVISQLRTVGLFNESQTSNERLHSLFFVTQLGRNTTASIGLQRVNFDSTVVSSYRENQFVSSVSVRF